MAEPSTDRLALLYRISQTFNSSLDLDHVLNHIIDEVITATHAERGFLMLREADGQMRFRAARGLDQRTIDSPRFKVSRSVIERVAQEGQPLLTSNAQDDRYLSAQDSIIGLGLRAILCVPLKLKDKTAGIIYVDNSLQAGIFIQADLELLVAIANQAAVAIENARLFCDLQDNLESLRLLQEISADLTSTLDLDQVLAACLERILTLFEADSASILIVEGDELVFRQALGEKAAEVKPFRVPIDQGVAGWVAQNAQGLYSNDVRSDPRFYTGVDSETGFITQALMAAPLIVNERVIGVIEVINRPGGFSDTDLDLLLTIGSSAAIAIDNARLYQVAVEKGRLERELQLAFQVQSSLIPLQTPDLPGWELAARWQPARQVSGDYYDFIPINLHYAPDAESPGHSEGLGLVIADVSDKGMAAALFMALSRSIVRASVAHTASPAAGIAQANRLICADAANGMFIKLFYAQLDPATGELTYVNAGHNPPVVYRAGQDQLIELERTGMVLGIFDSSTFGEHALQLGSDDFVLMYTDGVPDATNPQGQEFGMARLRDLVWDNRHAPAEHIAAALEGALKTFVAASAPFDDITFVIIKRL